MGYGLGGRVFSPNEEHSVANDLDEEPERLLDDVRLGGAVVFLDEPEKISHGAATSDQTDFR